MEKVSSGKRSFDVAFLAKGREEGEVSSEIVRPLTDGPTFF